MNAVTHAIEKHARAFFRAEYAPLDDESIEKLWQQNKEKRDIYMELARVQNNLQSFWNENRSTLIEKYGPMADKFPDELTEFVPNQGEFLQELRQCHLLLLTANQVENRMVTHLLYQYGNRKKLRWRDYEKCVYRLTKIGSIKVAHLVPLNTGSFSREGSRKAIERALGIFRPMLVVSLGVAFGVDANKQTLGDVLISQKILSNETNSRVDGKIILRSDETYFTSDQICTRWGSFLDSEIQPFEKYGFRWYFGPLLSGGSVVSDAEEKLRLIQAAARKEEKSIGGEMEGTGIYAECRGPDVPCIVIKGICDWGALKNGWDLVTDGEANNGQVKDCVQAFATQHAFEALYCLLSYAPIGEMPPLALDEVSPYPLPLTDGTIGYQAERPENRSFYFHDLKRLLVGGADQILKTEFPSNMAFLQALLPDYLCPMDADAAVRGEVSGETIAQFFCDEESSLRHICQKAATLLEEVEEKTFFQKMRDPVRALKTQGIAGALCYQCYLSCTAGPGHAERGLAVLTVYALLGPDAFQRLVRVKDGVLLFCR